MATKPGTAYTPPGYDDPNAAKPQVQDPWGRSPGDPQYGKSPTGSTGPAPTGQSSPMPGGSGTQPTGGIPSQPPSSTSQWTGSQPSSQPSSQNPLDLIKQYQSQNPGGKAQIPALAQYLNSQGIAASIGTHAGGTQASDDKIVLPDGTYYDLASDTGWTAPGQAQHWDPNVNVMDPTTGQFVKYGDYLQGKGLSVPQFIPRPGDGLPMPNPAAAGGLYAPGQTGVVPGTASSPNFLGPAPGGGGGGAPTVAAQTAQQLASAPNTSSGGMKGTLEGVLQGKMNQSLDINANDPIIQNQMTAYSAQQQGAARNYLQAAAEKAGPSGNISAETRSANERVGQANSAFQAQLMQQELTARRQEIMQSLQLGAGYITDEDKISLSKELAQLDNALQYARLGEQASEFGRSLAEQGSEFGQNLGQRQLESQMANQQFYSGLGQRSYEFDTTRSDNLFGGA